MHMDPTRSTAGRGVRSRTSTTAIQQYNADLDKKTASRRARRGSRQTAAEAGLTLLGSAHAPQAPAPAGIPSRTGAAGSDTPQQAPHSFTQTRFPAYHPTPDQSGYPLQLQNRYYAAPQHGSSPNPFQPAKPLPPMLTHRDWERSLINKELFTFADAGTSLPSTDAPQSQGHSRGFNPEEEDELFDDPDADFPDPSHLLTAGNAPAPLTFQAPPAILQLVVPPPSAVAGTASPAPELTTPQNLRVFPQATSSMSSTSVASAPRPHLIRRVRPTSTSGSPAFLSAAGPATLPSVPRLPLVHRTNIFGPGLHDHRQRPRESPQVVHATEKENQVHVLTSDDEEPAPPKKKSRKETAARSIVNVVLARVPVIEAGYTLIRLKVMTDESKTWLNQRRDLAEFSQDAFDYGVDLLKLDPDSFEPVQPLEQDLFRERIYGARFDFKEIAREIVKGPNGYDLRQCANNASKEQQAVVAAHNRAQVAMLTEKSAFVFTDPTDRTVKGTLYQHPSIEATIQKAAFDGLLSDGMQHPEFFDDTLPTGLYLEDDTQPPHQATFSLVTSANAINAIRASIMEYSSGHFVSETYSRKIFKPHFDAELKTLRAWRTYTSNPTIINGDGPVRTIAPSFLARTFQQKIFANARCSVLKDVVAPVVPAAVLDESDFAGNQ
ncbi:hypothetical protein DFH09DRAFT_1279588 [Mycena vulgaris]|nr:hypothetical protein DFH09DRAFT_1279588 [Mycena vulgaris]